MTRPTPVRLAYFVFEPKGGVDETLNPVIFQHGITACKENWDQIPQRVADATKRRTYSLDVRNHGDSEYTDDFSFELSVTDLLHFMDTMNITKAILVGHSMGGIISMRAALKEPEKVEMVISEDIHSNKVPQEIADRILELTNMRNSLIENMPPHLSDTEVVKCLLDYMFDLIPEELQMIKKTKDIYDMKIGLKRKEDGSYDLNYNKEVILKLFENVDDSFTELTGQYKGPAYFLYGKCSLLSVGSEEKHIKRYFPKAQLLPFEGATHFIHMEYPKEFTETLVRLIRSKL